MHYAWLVVFLPKRIRKHLATGLTALHHIYLAGLESGREGQGREGREETKRGGKRQDTSYTDSHHNGHNKMIFAVSYVS